MEIYIFIEIDLFYLPIYKTVVMFTFLSFGDRIQ